MSTLINISDIPLALYIHIPWCVKKCPYCDFNSHQLDKHFVINGANDNIKSRQLIDSNQFTLYVDALIKDIDSQLHLLQGREISSIFIGGGTPSLLPIKEYQRLFQHLNDILPLADDIEVTMEANPGTLEHAPFAEYLAVGINRLSMGVQTFANDKLKVLGRIHNDTQAQVAMRAAKEAGFNRINIDLMHGLPEQTVADALYDIRMAQAAGATHLSWYQLTIEPNTVFFRDTPILPEDDNLADIEEQGSALLTELGYRNYEVSAWVSAGDKECRHNINYWQFGDYLAIGAGAHGKVTIGDSVQNATANNEFSKIYRYSKSRTPKDYMHYIDHPKMVNFKAIAMQDLSGEFMLNVLRLTDGIPLAMYQQRTGLAVTDILPIIDSLKEKGLLQDKKQWIQTTELGRRYLNQVLHPFL